MICFINKRRKCTAILVSTLIFFLMIFSTVVHAENWMYKDGNWYYFHTFDVPVENQWITDGGNEYHIGSKGRMDTDKWIKDDETGEKYYVGLDGIKKRNTYTASGDKFVGPNGTELVSFGKWREEAKKSLKKVITALNKKQTVSSVQKEYLATLNAKNAAFALYDLNADGYKDIIVINKDSDNSQVLDVQLWIPEEEKYYVLMELDFTADETAVLKREPEEGNVWLIISRDINDFQFLRLVSRDYNFQDVEHYYFGYNEYGDVIYYINEDEMFASDWNTMLMDREASIGSGIPAFYYDLDEAVIKEQVDRYPSEEDIELFLERDSMD